MDDVIVKRTLCDERYQFAVGACALGGVAAMNVHISTRTRCFGQGVLNRVSWNGVPLRLVWFRAVVL